MIIENEIFVNAWLDELNKQSEAAKMFEQGKDWIPSRFEQKKFLMDMIGANQIESFSIVNSPVFYAFGPDGREDIEITSRKVNVIGMEHPNEGLKTLFILGWSEIPIMDILDFDGSFISRNEKRKYLIRMFTSEKIYRLK